MRVRIIFKLRNKGALLPFQHQHLLSDMIKNLATEYPQESFYNFSGLKGQTKISRAGLHYYSNRVTLVFSCLNDDFVNFFLRQLFKNHLLEVGEMILTPEYVEKEQTPKWQEAVKYVCLSPLVLQSDEQRSKDYISPDMDEYSDLLYESTMTRMERSGYFSAEEIADFYRFQVIPDTGYLQKVHKEDKKFSRIYNIFKPDGAAVEVRGYTFPFELYAHPQVHDFVFNCGFGEFNIYGYGMLDLAYSDHAARALPYEDFKTQNELGSMSRAHRIFSEK